MPRFVSAVVIVACLLGCGGGGGGPPAAPAVAPPVPTPAVSITATGASAFVLHSSLRTQWVVAMETPVRITENGGGTADWGYARMAIFLRGAEVERTELGANDNAAGGATRINANSNATYNLVFRFNSDDFDRIDITLGFTDRKDARQFIVSVPFNSFTGVNLSLTPLRLRWSPHAL